MVLSNVNVLEAMKSPRLDTKSDGEARAAMQKIMRDAYVLSGLDPQLMFEQLDDITHDLRASHPHLTFEEVRLACKAGISGELGGPKRPSYSAVMQWCEAYDRSAMAADCRKIRKSRKEEPRRLTPEEGLALMKRTMPEAAMRRWEDVRTTGTFGKGTIMHVSAQIYDWLGEEGTLSLSVEDRRSAMERAKRGDGTASAWDPTFLEEKKDLTVTRAKHIALQIWMQKMIQAGQGITLPPVRRIYQ